MKKINVKSDFDILVGFLAFDGKPVDFMPHSFRGELTTGLSKEAFRFSHTARGDTEEERWVNCHNDHGALHIVVNSHSLSLGQLRLMMEVDIPDSTYPDTIRTVRTEKPLDMLLTNGAGSDITEEEVRFVAPYVVLNLAEMQLVQQASDNANEATAAVRAIMESTLQAAEQAELAAEQATEATDKAAEATERAEAATTKDRKSVV